MLGKNSDQVDMFDFMIFEKLIPKDPVMMVKILLLEYLYRLSDVGLLSSAPFAKHATMLSL